MSQYHSINAGETERFFTVVARASGAPITSGTVNYYLKAKSGANAGKWWANATETWEVAETANAMTHEADGHWEIDLASTPFADGVRYLEYVKESGDLHVPQARHLIGNVVKEAVTLDWFADVSNPPTIGTSTLTQEQSALAAAAAIDAKGYLLQSPDEDETAVSRLTAEQVNAEVDAGISDAGLDTAAETVAKIAPRLIGTLSGAGTGTEICVYSGTTVTYTVDSSGNIANVVFS
jgi:hypothetical protein